MGARRARCFRMEKRSASLNAQLRAKRATHSTLPSLRRAEEPAIFDFRMHPVSRKLVVFAAICCAVLGACRTHDRVIYSTRPVKNLRVGPSAQPSPSASPGAPAMPTTP